MQPEDKLNGNVYMHIERRAASVTVVDGLRCTASLSTMWMGLGEQFFVSRLTAWQSADKSTSLKSSPGAGTKANPSVRVVRKVSPWI